MKITIIDYSCKCMNIDFISEKLYYFDIIRLYYNYLKFKYYFFIQYII